MSAGWIAAVVALWAVVLVMAVVLIGLFRRTVTVLEAAEATLSAQGPGDVPGGVPLLGVVADHPLWDSAGTKTRLWNLVDETSIILFLDSGCRPCRRLLSELDDVESVGIPLFVVLHDSEANQGLYVPPHVHTVFQRERTASSAFGTDATPHAFVIYPGGIVLERFVPRSIDDLKHAAERQKRGGEGFESVGEPASSAASGHGWSVLSEGDR